MVVNVKTIVFLHLCVLCLGSVRDGWPGYEDYPELNGWLKVHPEPVDWSTARANCHNEKALLVGPWTAEFTTTIYNIQSKIYPPLPVLYSGAGLRAGSPGLPLEPCDNKRCGVFLASGAMDKVKCDQRLPYVCYAPASSCGDGYVFKTETGQCYKFHDDEQIWSNVKRICQSEGAYVAKINSPTELKVLIALGDGLTFIDNDDGGPALRHLFGDDVDYDDEPYEDYACDQSHTFICEMTPKGQTDLRD